MINKPKKQTLQESAIILMLSTMLVKIISAFFKIPLASKQILGDLGFGYFSVAHDIFMPFYVLAISGLPVAVSHITAEYIAQNRFKDIKKTFYLTRKIFVLFGLLAVVLISSLALIITFASSSDNNTVYSILAVIPSIFLCFLISVYRGYYEGFRNMYPTAISKLIEALGKLVLGLGFSFAVIKITKNPALAASAAMAGITIGTLLATLYLHFSFKKNGEKLISCEQIGESGQSLTAKKTVKVILMLAIPMAVSSLVSSAVSLIDVITVKFQITNNSQEYLNALSDQYLNVPANLLSTFLYGIRSKAFTLYNLVPTLTMAFGVGALPVLTECWIKKDDFGVKENLNSIIKLIAVISFPAGIGLSAVSKPIMQLLYSDNTAFGGNMLFIYGLAAVFAGFAIPLTSVLQSFCGQFSALKNIIVGTVLKLVINIILIQNVNVNIYGAAIGTVICYMYISIAHLVSICKVSKKAVEFKTPIIKPFLASVCCGILAYLTTLLSDSRLVTCAAIIIAVIVYVLLLILFKTFTKQEILSVSFGRKLYIFGKKIKFLH